MAHHESLLLLAKHAIMKHLVYFSFVLLTSLSMVERAPKELRLFTANNPDFQYIGRIDFTDALKPRFWSPGVYIKAKFKGKECHVLINDEELYGKSHNYIEIAIDNEKPVRVQTTGKINDFPFFCASNKNAHTITICKDTEAGIGYIEFTGLKCEALLKLSAKPKHKIEYIGDSQTTGTGMDLTKVACDKGEWYDQHNAYMSYGPVTSRALNAQWQLTAVAGIGLIHSCCKMDILMPQVIDKVSIRDNKIHWDFNTYQPDIVTVCLGQNDGAQDSTTFCSTYVKFIHSLRQDYPEAKIICLTSPMADKSTTFLLQKYLTSITTLVNNEGDKKVYKYFFSQRYSHGCGTHPDMAEHQQIAGELAAYIKTITSW